MVISFCTLIFVSSNMSVLCSHLTSMVCLIDQCMWLNDSGPEPYSHICGESTVALCLGALMTSILCLICKLGHVLRFS